MANSRLAALQLSCQLPLKLYVQLHEWSCRAHSATDSHSIHFCIRKWKLLGVLAPVKFYWRPIWHNFMMSNIYISKASSWSSCKLCTCYFPRYHVYLIYYLGDSIINIRLSIIKFLCVMKSFSWFCVTFYEDNNSFDSIKISHTVKFTLAQSRKTSVITWLFVASNRVVNVSRANSSQGNVESNKLRTELIICRRGRNSN